MSAKIEYVARLMIVFFLCVCSAHHLNQFPR